MSGLKYLSLVLVLAFIVGCYPTVDEGAFSTVNSTVNNSDSVIDNNAAINSSTATKNIDEAAQDKTNISSDIAVDKTDMPNVSTDENALNNTEETVSDDSGMDDVTGAIVSDDNTDATQTKNSGVEITLSPKEVLSYKLDSVDETKYPYMITVKEGELVELSLQATDPDGDALTYSYSAPLNNEGKWQTEVGEAGYYVVKVVVSDGEFDTEQDVLIKVESINKAPIIEPISDVVLSEGQTIAFVPRVSDPDGDDVKVSYSGWITEDTYKTTYKDAGVHEVVITATDGKSTTTETVQVTVLNVNRAPIIQTMKDITVDEGELVTLEPVAADPDGDDITFTYSEPFDSEGKWQTEIGDAGTRTVRVTASDGEKETYTELTVTINSLNKAPVLSPIAPIVVYEGDTIRIEPNATDAENDPLVFSYSGWMNSSVYQTKYTDAGSYIVTVTVSDGVNTDSQDVVVTVKNKNRPPTFILE